MKKFLKVANNVFSWVFNIVMFAALILAVYSFAQSRITGESASLFGYRPMYILTGSMEPAMRTNSLAITKNLSPEEIDNLEKGDVITYHVYDVGNEVNAQPKKITITHRIYNIKEENGEKRFVTKGDNNRTADAYSIGPENVDAIVVCTWNQFADIVAKWQSGWMGKLLVCSPLIIIFLLYICVKSFFGGDDDNDNDEPKKKNKKGKKQDSQPEVEEPKAEFKMPTFYESNNQ